MPKNYGFKEKDQVIEHVVGMLVEGRLRTGDRVDRNKIADELGLSRVPVQEALVQLEHDGLIVTEYHRGAFAARFDAQAVREHHEVYGLLSGMASARAARHPTPRLVAQLKVHLQGMRDAEDSSVFQENIWAFRRLINVEYGGPRLRAAIKASQTFMPQAFWVSYRESQPVTLAFYEAEYQAIRRADPVRARAICTERSKVVANVVITELVNRGVFPPEEQTETDAGAFVAPVTPIAVA